MLSIPFIGIFALHRCWAYTQRMSSVWPFNSLYWDFCFASHTSTYLTGVFTRILSIPFIGIFALHRGKCLPKRMAARPLSIPFIGIFALHRAEKRLARLSETDTFNSLYWDFCFASL